MTLIPCPACGNQCSPLAPHCPDCGHPFSQTSETSNVRKWKYAALALAAFTFLTLGALLVYESSNRVAKVTLDSQTPSPSPSPSIAQEEKQEPENPIVTTTPSQMDTNTFPPLPSPTPSAASENQSAEEAVIISENANLRYAATVESNVIREVGFGERLRLKSRTPIGPWYKVYDEVTGSEGWVHGNTIKIE